MGHSLHSSLTTDHTPVKMVESVVTRQLRSASRRLRFDESVLETSFREHHYQRLRPSVCTHLGLGMALLLTFLAIDQLLLAREQTPGLIALRLGAVLSVVLCTGATASTAPWARNYHHWIMCLAPVFGLCVVANELVDQPLGISFLPAIVITLMGIYLLLGMLFLPALCVGIMVLAAYLGAALWQQLPLPELFYNGTVLLFTNIIGATACYSMERLGRRGFLEARLLADMANRDGLTGIHNRRALDEHMDRLWLQALRENVPVPLLLIDIDHFKAFNDFYGHQAGDECLRQVASLLSGILRRPLDLSARYGGEEFAVVLYNPTRAYAEGMAGAIQDELSHLSITHAAAPHGRLTVSIGAVFAVPRLDHSIKGLVQLADQALYAAKDAGRDRWVMEQADYEQFVTGAHRSIGTRGQRISA